MEEKKILKRSEIPEQYTWNLKDIYNDVNEWNDDLAKVYELLKKVEDYKGKLSSDAKTLLSWFEFNDELGELISKVYGYSSLEADQDVSNSETQARKGKALSAYVAINSALSFADTEIMEIADDKLEEFFKEEEGLELYRLAIKRIRHRKDHMLSANEESGCRKSNRFLWIIEVHLMVLGI